MRRFFWFFVLFFFPDLEDLIKYEVLTLRAGRTFSFHHIEIYCVPHSSPKKGEDGGDTNIEHENHCCQWQEVEDN